MILDSRWACTAFHTTVVKFVLCRPGRGRI